MQHTKTLLATGFAVAALFGCDQPAAEEAAAEPTMQPANEAPVAEVAKTAENAAQDPHAAHVAAAAEGPAMPAIPAGAKIEFVAPAPGTRVAGPLVDGKVEVDVKMGAVGIKIEPAGTVTEGSGHHHVLLDLKAIEAGTVVPKDESHIHFGGGQTEAKIMLTPGSHTLTLQLADGIHRSYGPDLSATTTVEVVAAE